MKPMSLGAALPRTQNLTRGAEETAGRGKSAFSVGHRAQELLAAGAVAEGAGPDHMGKVASRLARGLDCADLLTIQESAPPAADTPGDARAADDPAAAETMAA